jgi:uncharacterized protein YndB with AHSA1/START domain
MCMVSAAIALGLAASAAGPGLALEERVEGDGARTQIFTVDVAAPRQEVWAAMTTADGWKRWAVPAAWQTSSDPLVIVTSYDPKAAPDAPQTIKQQFDRLDPPSSLSFRTIKAPAGFPGFETYKHVVTKFTLGSKADGGTSITFESGPFPDTDEGRRLYGFFKDGNRVTLERLARVLSKTGDAR